MSPWLARLCDHSSRFRSTSNKLHSFKVDFLYQYLNLCTHTIFESLSHIVKALANEDTLLPTQMIPLLPACTTLVADTKNVSDFVQKHFVSATNVS